MGQYSATSVRNKTRATYRNEMRQSTGTIRAWSETLQWVRANIKAKWEQRRVQCAEARKVASKATAEAIILRTMGVPITKAVSQALLDFWNNQPRTRVVSRIIRGL